MVTLKTIIHLVIMDKVIVVEMHTSSAVSNFAPARLIKFLFNYDRRTVAISSKEGA